MLPRQLIDYNTPCRTWMDTSLSVDLILEPSTLTATHHLWPFGNRTWAYHGLTFGQPLWFVAVLVIKLVPWCIWLLSGTLEIPRSRLQPWRIAEKRWPLPTHNHFLFSLQNCNHMQSSQNTNLLCCICKSLAFVFSQLIAVVTAKSRLLFSE